MKRFTAVALAALMVLTVFAAYPASAADTVEIRSQVYNASDVADGITITSKEFAGFYYDLNDNLTSETLQIDPAKFTSPRTIEENGLIYTCNIAGTNYEYEGDWANDKFPVLGFFAEKYVPLLAKDKPLFNAKPDKLAKLLVDSDTKQTLKTGDKLDLGSGYTLEAKQVDVDGKKVWLEFSKDGQYIDDEIVDVSGSAAAKTWAVDLDNIQGEDNIVVMKVHVNQVFQGAVDSIAQIEGVWLIDYQNAKTLKTDDTYGEFKVKNINNGVGEDNLGSLVLKNDNSVTLTQDSVQDLGQGLKFKIADDSTLRFYLMKEFTEAGKYEIRGSVASEPFTWDAKNFAGFFYDINDNVYSETLAVKSIDGRTIDENDLVYTADIAPVDYEYGGDWDGQQYPVLGFFAEKYVPLVAKDKPLYEAHADKLAKLILDSDTKYTLKTGDKLDLGSGYTLEAKQVDVDGKKVWLEFAKDGQYIDDEIVDVSGNASAKTWAVDLDDVQGEDNIVVMKVHVNQVFQGAVDSIAQIEGVWLIDYKNAMEIKSDAEFDELEMKSIKDGVNASDLGGLVLQNKNSITLTQDSDQNIANGMKFKVADDSALRYYLFVEKTLGAGVPGANATENVTATPSVVTTPTGNVTPTENVTAPVTTPAANETAPTNETEKKPTTPGFGFVYGVAGLLGVIYLVRRNN